MKERAKKVRKALKNGKKNDIVQKGGEGLSLNHSFEFVLKEWHIWGEGGH